MQIQSMAAEDHVQLQLKRAPYAVNMRQIAACSGVCNHAAGNACPHCHGNVGRSHLFLQDFLITCMKFSNGKSMYPAIGHSLSYQ